jgi:hypothetical protein
VTTEFVNDPIVPLELGLGGGVRRYTLYQPGWYVTDSDTGSFLGKEGEVYGFDSLEELADYIEETGADGGHDLARSEHFADVLEWSQADFEDRVCVYDLPVLTELIDKHLDQDEQASLGSTLALLLDLLDYANIEDEHSDALRDDDDVNKLAAGDEVLAVFTAERHRQHVVELLQEHWAPCVATVASHVGRPD